MIQMEKYDYIILQKIQNKDIIVDSDNGIIFGKMLDENNERRQIGHKSRSGKKYFVVLQYGKTIVYPVCRAVYLSNKSIPTGHEVYHKNGNLLDDKIVNLSVREYKKSGYYSKKWSKKDDSWLKDNYTKKSIDQLSDFLKRSNNAIRNRMEILNLCKFDRRKKWTDADDQELKKMYGNPIYTIEDIAKKLGKGQVSVRLRANRIGKIYRSDKHLREDLSVNNFYLSFKSANARDTLVSKCCLCDYNKYIELHHKDGNRKNNHISNMATLCPNHHAEITGGEHKEKLLYAIWRRKYSDGSLGQEHDNLKEIKSKNTSDSV